MMVKQVRRQMKKDIKQIEGDEKWWEVLGRVW